MNIIMNKNMKKRMDSAIDLYWFANGNGGNKTEFQFRCIRVGGIHNGKSTKFFADVHGSYSRPDFPLLKNKILVSSNIYRANEISTFKRKFSRMVVTYKSNGTTIFTDTIDMVSGIAWETRFSTDSGAKRWVIVTTSNGISSTSGNISTVNTDYEAPCPSGINYPILTKTAYKNGIAYNQAKVTGTVDGNVRVSLIAPFDIPPTQTGVVIDSFQIEFFDDFDRPTAIVTGTIGDLNSTADVKMANTLIEDGAYINISGMDDFLITTPNTIAISN